MTMLGSFGGGIWSVMYSLFKNDGRVDILDLINGILSSLVSVTAGCFLYRAWEAILIGFIGSVLVRMNAMLCVSKPILGDNYSVIKSRGFLKNSR
jgi:ammonia channel protein AmtB